MNKVVKFSGFRSIRIRVMSATTLLIFAMVGAVVWLWVNSESHLYRKQKWNQAKSIALLLSQATNSPLNTQNWSSIRASLDLVLLDSEEVVYCIVSDARLSNQIVAASPPSIQEEYVPDIVPVWVTEAALVSSPRPRAVETFILRDLEFPKKYLRAYRGEQVMEVASDIRNSSGDKIGVLRVGISLREVNRAIRNGVKQALGVGVVGLSFGLVGAYIVAGRLSNPIRRLQLSAAKIAAGDLDHRAEINRADEIGALATSFNEMSAALQATFSKLQKTVESFERFVPEKFLSVIASDGIENIQVGVASTRIITILFADIRGYTSLSEQLTPLETFSMLNDYLACMGQAIDQAGGFIDKYIGDAIMALFDDEATDNALYAAIKMQQTLDIFNQKRSRYNLPTIEIGIGIHRGEVVMGTVGYSSRIESTVIGDAVNVASRVENLTRQYGSPVLLTAAAVEALRHPEAFQLRLVDQRVKVKGKDELVGIYELLIKGNSSSKGMTNR